MISESAKNRVLFQDPPEFILLKRCADSLPGFLIRIFLRQEEEKVAVRSIVAAFVPFFS